ncbi:DUF1707 domain-containing protein [Spirillospora sp. NPDC029432]|uniref:DUF1707 SHOCT-like domain-containing protein n=1 Tax=Spirillospora sp. NPDC029432 TaxID=3154599 RepID=UPI003452154E
MTRTDEMRIGDAERDAVTTALHEHFAAGRLDREELDERLGATLAAKTHGDLRAIVRDLPGPSGLPEPARAPVPGHWAYAHGHHLRHHHGHHPHHSRHAHRFPAFPLMVGLFIVLAIAAGPGTAMLAVLQFALLVWIVRAVLFAVRSGRPRPR